MTAAATRRQASNAMPSRASSNDSGYNDGDDDEDDDDDDVFFLGPSSGGPTRLFCFVFGGRQRGDGTETRIMGGKHKKMALLTSQSAGRNCCIIQYGTEHISTVRHGTLRDGTGRYGTVHYSIVLYRTAWNGTVRYGRVQYLSLIHI